MRIFADKQATTTYFNQLITKNKHL